MSTKPIDAALARLVRILRSEEDIRRGIRVDQRIANDGNVILDDDLGLIRLIENIDAARAAVDANTISLVDALAEIAALEALKNALRVDVDAHEQEIIGLENTKRNTADQIPQADIDGLGTTLSSIGRRFVYDSFTAANGTVMTGRAGETGATWTSDGGAFTIHNGRIYGTATGFLYASGIPPTADYSVEAEFTHFNSTGENAIALRVQPGANTGYYLYYNFGSFRLFSIVSGSVTNLGSVVWSTANMPVVAGITATGSSIQIVINGIVRATYTSTAITAAGRAGLYSIPIATNTGQHLDRFAAKAPMAQTDVVDLVSNLANKLEPGTSQNNIDGLVTALSDKASNAAVQAVDTAGLKTVRLLADDSTTTSSADPIGTINDPLAFVVNANTTYLITASLDYQLSAESSGAQGAGFGVILPSGSTVIGSVISWLSNSIPRYNWRLSTPGVTTYKGFGAGSTAIHDVEMRFAITIGATSGIAYIATAMNTSGHTITILKGSYATIQQQS